MKSIRPHFLSLTLAGLLSAASASAMAQAKPDPAPERGAPTAGAASANFMTFDSNADGKISLEEFKAQGGGEQTFAAIDANQDLGLNNGEFSKLEKPSAQRY
ncbi:MAG: hypothetical protein ACYCY9_04320 [Thiobacillus sp.]